MKNQLMVSLTLFCVFAGTSTALSERTARKTSVIPNSRSQENAAVPGKSKRPLGKVYELTVNLVNGVYIDFDTATALHYPSNMSGETETVALWEENNGIDACFSGNKHIVHIYEHGIIAAPVSDDKWNCTQEELMFELAKAQWVGDLHPGKALGNTARFELFGKEARSTFVFKTQQGNAGVLQLQDGPRLTVTRGTSALRVKLRYWLLKNTTVKIADEQIIWGKPVKGIVCAVRHVKKSIFPGDIFEYDILYKNVSTQPLTVCTYSDFLYIWTQLQILNTEGSIVARGGHASGITPPLELSDFVTIKPGEIASARQRMRAAAVKRLAASSPNRPRRFAARVSISGINPMEKHVPGFDAFCKKHNIKPWTGVIESGPSPFTVKPKSQIVEGVRYIFGIIKDIPYILQRAN